MNEAIVKGRKVLSTIESYEVDGVAEQVEVVHGAYCNWPRKLVTAISGKRWFLVMLVGDRMSERVREFLSDRGLEPYAPRIKSMRNVPRDRLSAAQRKRGIPIKRPAEEPMFPGYAFVRFDLADGRWHEIFEFVGIRGIGCEGDMPVPMPVGFVEGLKRQEVDGLISGSTPLVAIFGFEAGEDVRVTEGAFAGFNAVVERGYTAPLDQFDESVRVSLLASLFGRACKVEVPVSSVAKL